MHACITRVFCWFALVRGTPLQRASRVALNLHRTPQARHESSRPKDSFRNAFPALVLKGGLRGPWRAARVRLGIRPPAPVDQRIRRLEHLADRRVSGAGVGFCARRLARLRRRRCGLWREPAAAGCGGNPRRGRMSSHDRGAALPTLRMVSHVREPNAPAEIVLDVPLLVIGRLRHAACVSRGARA